MDALPESLSLTRFRYGPFAPLSGGPPPAAALIATVYSYDGSDLNTYVSLFIIILFVSARAFVRASWWEKNIVPRWNHCFDCSAVEVAPTAATGNNQADSEAPKPQSALPHDLESLRVALHQDFRFALREVKDEEPPPGLVLVIESSKTIPLLYLILSLPSIDSYVCGLPRCMYEPPVSGTSWSAFGTIPAGPSAPMNFNVFHELGYTDKQIMALWVLNSTFPTASYMFALLSGEVGALGFFLFNLSRLHKKGFYIPALIASGLLTVLWACFELQTSRALHLWNTPFNAELAPIANKLNATHQLWMDEKGVETVLCYIPFGAWTSRAFAFIHALGALYYVYQLTPPGCCYRRDQERSKFGS